MMGLMWSEPQLPYYLKLNQNVVLSPNLRKDKGFVVVKQESEN